MKKLDRELAAALLTAGIVIFASAFWPCTPRGAWWCTTFSISCAEVIEQPGDGNSPQKVEFRWRIADWVQSLLG